MCSLLDVIKHPCYGKFNAAFQIPAVTQPQKAWNSDFLWPLDAFGAAWSDPVTGKTADWGILLLAWSMQNIFILCWGSPQFSVILEVGEGN